MINVLGSIEFILMQKRMSAMHDLRKSGYTGYSVIEDILRTARNTFDAEEYRRFCYY